MGGGQRDEKSTLSPPSVLVVDSERGFAPEKQTSAVWVLDLGCEKQPTLHV